MYLNIALSVLSSFALSAYPAVRNVILLPLSFYQYAITLWICNCLGFAFVILTQTHQICGMNYYFKWDTLLGSPATG